MQEIHFNCHGIVFVTVDVKLQTAGNRLTENKTVSPENNLYQLQHKSV